MLLYSLEALGKVRLMSIHNICFCGEIRKISILLDWKKKSALTSGMYVINQIPLYLKDF